jgi:HEAT repeat protein
MLRGVLKLALVLSLFGAGGVAEAAPAPKASDKGGKKPPEAEASKLDAAKLKAELESADPARISAALDVIAASNPRATELSPLVEALLRRGATIKVSFRAIEVAGVLGQPAASAAVAPYLKHRDAGLRRAAVRALLLTRGPDAVKALRHALRSSDPAVRGPAATGLGDLGATDAVPDLLRALDHNVIEAGEAIGQLCDVEHCKNFVGRLGRLPFDIMTAGIQAMLFRPSEQLPDVDKVAVVAAVGELGTSEARRFLRTLLERWPETGSDAVRKALVAAARGEKVP